MKPQTKNYIFLFVALLLIGAGFFVYTLTQEEVVPSVSQLQYRNSSADNIVISKPLPTEIVAQAFTIEGKARGGWYFEASFPIEVKSPDGKVLTTAIAHAQGEWMTELFVPYTAQIQIPDMYHGTATIVLKKDNPSGMTEKDASLSFSVYVK